MSPSPSSPSPSSSPRAARVGPRAGLCEGWGVSCGRRSPLRALILGAALILGIASVLGVLASTAGTPPASAHTIPGGWDPLDPAPVHASIDTFTPDAFRSAFTLQAYAGIAHFDLQGAPGRTVVVYGYDGEPYLRIDADGGTYQNDTSPSVVVNADNGGTIPTTASSSSSSPPAWRLIDATRHIQWHDHRIHWMQVGPPPTRPGTDVIQDWSFTVQVDGVDGTVSGQLHRIPDVGWQNYIVAIGGPTFDPPPSRTAWGIAAAVFTVVATGVGLFVRRQRADRHDASASPRTHHGRGRPPPGARRRPRTRAPNA